MPTITSNGTGGGLWSAGATWVGGSAPVDNDTVVIASGDTVTYETDMSDAGTWPNGIAGITITGTLKLSRSTSGYLKIKAATTIAGAGTFDCGASSSDAIPFAVKHTITGGAAWYIQGSGGLTMTVYAAEPAIKTILLSGDEAIGQTVLSVDTDITGDIWADGDTIRIDDINKAQESEERVIAAGGRAAGTITVTAGLTAAKSTGAVVSLCSRNVKFIGVGAAGYIAQNFASGKLTIAGGQWYTATYRVIYNSTGVVISGGAFHANAQVLNTNTSSSISGGVFSGNSNVIANSINTVISGGSFSGSDTIITLCFGTLISGGTHKGNNSISNAACAGTFISGGTFSGNAYVINGAFATVIGGTFTNHTAVFNSCYADISGISLAGNTYGVQRSQFRALNAILGSATENYLYTNLAKETYSESIDHGQVAGAFKSWTKGGVTTKQATTYPVGKTYSMQLVLADASNEGFWQREVTVGAGASINITSYLRKSASMAYLPRVIIFNKAETDPFAGGAGIDTFTMTDSVDTWESDVYTYYNSTSEDVTIVIRTQGMNASGNVFSLIEVEQINVDLTTLINNLATVDTVVDAIKAKTDNLPSDPVGASTVVEGTITVQQALRVLLAAMAGKASGGGTTSVIFRDTTDSKDRITATVDSDGNRSAVTLDPS